MSDFDIPTEELPDFPDLPTVDIKKTTTPKKRKSPTAGKNSEGSPAKKANNSEPNSPMPKSKSEIKEYDQLLLDLRAQNVKFDDILPRFIAAGGHARTVKHIRDVRMPVLNALSVELSESDMESLKAAVTKVEETYQKGKFLEVAKVLKTDADIELKPSVIAKKWAEFEKKGST